MVMVIVMAFLLAGCGEKEPEEIKIPLTVVNDTGIGIYELYASVKQTDDWEEDILGDGILAAGESGRIYFTMDSDTQVWDFAICDYDDNMVEFYDLDFSDCSTDGATLYLEYDGETAYATLE